LAALKLSRQNINDADIDALLAQADYILNNPDEFLADLDEVETEAEMVS
jgi:hypothetical protein